MDKYGWFHNHYSQNVWGMKAMFCDSDWIVDYSKPHEGVQRLIISNYIDDLKSNYLNMMTT
jgi:hypothetical protein